MSDSASTTVAAAARAVRGRLAAIYPPGEAQAIVRVIFEYLKGWSAVDLALHSDDGLSEFMLGKIGAIEQRLLKHEPIQYITGEASFFGLRLRVTPDTLIPRPETAELVDMALRHCGDRTDLSVLDAGTGSGCIALALARNLRFPQITAIDISEKALEVARDNARRLKCRVDFRQADMLRLPAHREEWDVIVSNPPYVCEREKGAMEANVLDWEPHVALFVPDADPLRFYRALGRYAASALRPGGALFFEINPDYADGLAKMLREQGLEDVTVSRDMEGRLRFASALKPCRDD